MFEQRLVANVADCLWKPWMATVHTLYHFSTCCVILASSKKKKQQGHKKLSNPEECLKKPLQLKSEKTTSSIMKKRQSTFPLRWMEGINHASNWKCRRSLHNYQTTKYKDVKDVSKNSRDHKFKYNVGKQTLC